MTAPDDILIVGGGFAGFWAAVASRRVAGDAITITLVSREPVLQMRPRLYEADPQNHGIDQRALLAGVGICFLQGEAVDLDVSRDAVTLADGGERRYRRLVVTTGSTLRRPPVAGAETAWSIDDQHAAIAFDRRLATIARTIPAPRIVVVGAGFTGIELALELRDRLEARGGADVAERATITLVERSDVVGPDLGPGPRPLIEAALAAGGVESLLEAHVTSIEPESVSLSDGRRIDADAVVLTTGMEAAPFVRKVPGQHDELGRVFVERTLRAPAAPHVFVAGDAASVDCGDGHGALQSCQHALQSGRFAGENAARSRSGMDLLPFTPEDYVTCLDLGRAGAVFTEGWERKVTMSGMEAKALKRRINTQIIYPPADVPAATLLERSSTDPRLQGEEVE